MSPTKDHHRVLVWQCCPASIVEHTLQLELPSFRCHSHVQSHLRHCQWPVQDETALLLYDRNEEQTSAATAAIAKVKAKAETSENLVIFSASRTRLTSGKCSTTYLVQMPLSENRKTRTRTCHATNQLSSRQQGESLHARLDTNE